MGRTTGNTPLGLRVGGKLVLGLSCVAYLMCEGSTSERDAVMQGGGRRVAEDDAANRRRGCSSSRLQLTQLL